MIYLSFDQSMIVTIGFDQLISVDLNRSTYPSINS
ncbi:uncharacterized protein METZ01_LOCUS92174 [marine metagenome]|uniref:Uncharacterized protein n=1 Tax=marine metagenome TaxID=408172 RepID=A0A381VG64_9ZZZZ